MNKFSSLNEVLKLLKEEDKVALASIMLKIQNQKIKKICQEVGGELTIDLHELESLVNPQKFEFPKEDIGQIGVSDEQV